MEWPAWSHNNNWWVLLPLFSNKVNELHIDKFNSIYKEFYGLVTVFSIRDFITLSNKLINKLYDNYTKRFNEFKSRFRIFLYIVFFILLFILGKLFL